MQFCQRPGLFASSAGRPTPLALAAAFSALLLAASAPAVQLTLQIVDDQGADVPARIQVKDATGHYYAQDPDSILMSHQDWPWMKVYFYTHSPLTMDIAPGVATVMAGRGFEIRPVRFFPNVTRDTTFVVTLHRSYDLRSLGWYGGDTHVHMRHNPVEYPISPEAMHRICQAEDLAMAWMVDQEYHFTGAPDPVSTPDAIMYFCTEWRNQAYGHVSLVGLKEMIGTGCCWAPYPAYPMLSDLREDWNPGWDELMVLNHPRNGAGFFDDDQWPAWGLAREVPVQAASGSLDAYDICSFSNEGDVTVSDWYALLNLGLHIPAGAGTDAIMDRYWTRPAGGYRVYVKEDGVHNPSDWAAGEKAGRSFVSNFPLIPEFTVNGQEAGSTVDLLGPSQDVAVHFVVASVLPVRTAKLIRNGQEVASFNVPSGLNGSYGVFDTQVTLDESSWLALRVDGTTDVLHAVSSSLFAHTSPVYVRLDSLEVYRTEPAGYYSDWLDSLQIFVEHRGGWEDQGSRQHVLQRIQSSRAFFGDYFRIAPSSAELMAPADSETLSVGAPVLFDWSASTDPEAGDRISYRLSVSTDTTFFGGYTYGPIYDDQYQFTQLPFPADRSYWWRVTSLDRGGNFSLSTPARRSFYLSGVSSVDPADGTATRLESQLRVWPNPSSGRFRFLWNQQARQPGLFEVFTAGGRMVRRVAATATAAPGTIPGAPAGCPSATWDGLDSGGRAVPSGVYWVRYLSSRSGAPANVPGSRTSMLVIR